MIYDLPRALTFGGREWAINTDFRDVLVILLAFEDPDLDEQQKAYVCIHNLYVDDGEIPREQIQAAFEAALGFIDHGSGDDRPGPRTMDWEQDAALIFPAVNRVAGCEVRALPYCRGYCYTQLTDVMQEINGLMTPDRVAKVDVERFREINGGAGNRDQAIGTGNWE